MSPDDERGATILGRSEEITSVLSSLEFSGDPNRVSGSVTIKASDQDQLTEDVIKEIQISNIKSSPPKITVPKTKINVKADVEAPFTWYPGVRY